jgi:hypothetical protein
MRRVRSGGSERSIAVDSLKERVNITRLKALDGSPFVGLTSGVTEKRWVREDPPLVDPNSQKWVLVQVGKHDRISIPGRLA